MGRFIHLIKLSVGTEDVADLAHWQGDRRYQTADGLPRHVTRMWPKREAEVLAGGSVYWVIKGLVLCRQRVLRLDRVEGSDGVERCALVLDPALVQVAPAPKRPFQGWRYLEPKDAPPDLAQLKPGDDVLPPELTRVLADIGVF